jgi:hypothetical protein
MKRIVSGLAAITLMASFAVLASPAASSARSVQHPASIMARQFTATGTLGEYYTRQTVTGVYKNRRGRPLNVTVYDYAGRVLAFSAKPRLDTSFWGNYWHDTYGLDQWLVGGNLNATYHFMLPPPPMGSTFRALLVSEFNGGGNWQNWMDGTSTRVGG